MGTTLGKPFAGFFKETELRFVLFGLDGTGKSSIMLHKLKTEKFQEVLRSYLDVGYILKTHSSCFHYFQQVSGLVLVVHSTDRDRIEEARDFLNMVIDEIQGSVPDNAAVLVYGNKYEVPGAMSASEINKLDLASLHQ